MSDCCEKCDWLEDKIESNIENQIKEAQLLKLFAKNNLINTISNVKPSILKNKEDGHVVEIKTNIVIGTDNKSDISEVGTNSSQ